MTREDFFKDLDAMGIDNARTTLADNEPLMSYLETGGFFTAPASTHYHGAYEGGLYEHSLNVCRRLQDVTDKMHLQWMRPESPMIIGLFHDLCKCDQYIPITDQDGNVTYKYNTEMKLKGHGSKSVMILSKLMFLTEEEINCIRYHMGAYEKDEWKELDLAIREFPNVLYTHLADMLASKIDENE